MKRIVFLALKILFVLVMCNYELSLVNVAYLLAFFFCTWNSGLIYTYFFLKNLPNIVIEYFNSWESALRIVTICSSTALFCWWLGRTVWSTNELLVRLVTPLIFSLSGIYEIRWPYPDSQSSTRIATRFTMWREMELRIAISHGAQLHTSLKRNTFLPVSTDYWSARNVHENARWYGGGAAIKGASSGADTNEIRSRRRSREREIWHGLSRRR